MLDDRQNYLELTERFEQVGPMTYKERKPTMLQPNNAAQKEKDEQFQESLPILLD